MTFTPTGRAHSDPTLIPSGLDHHICVGTFVYDFSTLQAESNPSLHSLPSHPIKAALEIKDLEQEHRSSGARCLEGSPSSNETDQV